jgi:ABC-type multidrug transport system fused ATPase/permease subunit
MRSTIRGLKGCLWIAGIVCLLSVCVMFFMPLSAWEFIAKYFGVEALPDSPMFVYVARLTSAMWTVIGVFFIILAMNPAKYEAMIPFAGLAMVFLGMVCWVTGLAMGMPSRLVLSDALSSIVLGTLIFALWNRAKRLQKNPSGSSAY